MGRNSLTGVQLKDIKAEVRKRYVKLETANADFLRVFGDRLKSISEKEDGKEDDNFARRAAKFLSDFAKKHDLEDIDEDEIYDEIKGLSFWEEIQRIFGSKLGRIAYSLLFPAIMQLYNKYKEGIKSNE